MSNLENMRSSVSVGNSWKIWNSKILTQNICSARKQTLSTDQYETPHILFIRPDKSSGDTSFIWNDMKKWEYRESVDAEDFARFAKVVKGLNNDRNSKSNFFS